MSPIDRLPAQRRDDLARARRLEWINIGFTISIIIVMGLALGQSQAMKTAWIEDTLGLIPPIVFLVAMRFEMRKPSRNFQHGFDRVHSLGFLIVDADCVVGNRKGWDCLGAAVAILVGGVCLLPPFGGWLWRSWKRRVLRPSR